MATAVLRRLRRENPEATITVQTAYPDVFKNNPHLVVPEGFYPPGYRLIDLDLAYEKRPRMHVVEAYMHEAFGDGGNPSDWRPELFPASKMKLPAYSVAVHAAKSGWSNRTLPKKTWLEVIQRLRLNGFNPILVGTQRDSLPEAECVGFFEPNLMSQASLIRACSAFIGSDSALMHVAVAVGTPVAAAFTCALPQFRITPGAFARGVIADISCAGCLHELPAPQTTENCKNIDFNACTNRIAAFDLVKEMLRAKLDKHNG